MGKRQIVFGLACMVIFLAAIGCNCRSSEATKKEVRLGVYDSRAVAVAYVHSNWLEREMKAKMAEMKKAKTEGDTKKIEKLEEWGKAHQAKIHRQGFSTAPVDDILEHIKDSLPGIIADANVVELVSKWDKKTLNSYRQAKLVDVTDKITALFKPNKKGLDAIEQMKEEKPIPLWKLKMMMTFENH